MSQTNVPRRLTRIAIAGVAVAVGLAAIGCGGSSSTGPQSGQSRYYMTASIDGAAWQEDPVSAAAVGAVWAGPGLYTITGYSSASATTIAITLNTIRGPDTYPFGVNIGVAGGTAQVSNTSSGWTTRLSGAAGTITITLLTQTEIAGTFSFVANGLLNAPATSTKNVTSGTFDLPIKAFGTIGPVPANAGSVITGTIAGQPFNMATITTSLSATRGNQGQTIGTTLIFGGGTETMGIGAAVAGINGAGSYALGPGTVANGFNSTTMNASLTNGSAIQAWNSSDSTSFGVVTISSFTNTRIKGTFTANLGPAIGTSARINISGAFDLGVP
jgi:hypothetical protein